MKKYFHIMIGIIIGAVLTIPFSSFATDIGKTVEATFAKFNFIVNGQTKQLEADPLVYQGSTYLPVRVAANMLGHDVTYKADSRTIVFESVSQNVYGVNDDLSINNDLMKTNTKGENSPVNEKKEPNFSENNKGLVTSLNPDETFENDSAKVTLYFVERMSPDKWIVIEHPEITSILSYNIKLESKTKDISGVLFDVTYKYTDDSEKTTQIFGNVLSHDSKIITMTENEKNENTIKSIRLFNDTAQINITFYLE